MSTLMKIDHGFVENDEGSYTITFKLTAPSPTTGALLMVAGIVTVIGVLFLGFAAAFTAIVAAGKAIGL